MPVTFWPTFTYLKISDHLEKIWVIVIVNNAQILSNYNLAQNTLRCYCQLNGYPLEVINTSEMGKENNNCKQKDVSKQYNKYIDF